jgi:CubicO group peptidase (beta-lactamase class C family)
LKGNRKKLSIERLNRVETMLDRYVTEGKLPGYNCLISQNFEEVAYFQNGLKDVEQTKPMDRNTVFRIYSMTKPLTSIAIMQLYEQGLCLLDDPVHRYIPEWRNLKVFISGDASDFEVTKPDRAMTIKDLLLHTSGLTYGFQESHPVDQMYRNEDISSLVQGATLAGMAEQLVDIPLQFSPGTQWNYSVSTDVLGYLVEIISGQSLDAYLQDNILTPLAMNDTGFSVRPDQQQQFAACYDYLIKADENGHRYRLSDDPKTSRYLEKPTLLSGGGGLVSTIDDYYIFTKMLLGKGEYNGVRVLGSKTIEYMSRNHLPQNNDLAAIGRSRFTESGFNGVGFGLGFSVVMNAAQSGVLCSDGELAWGGMASTCFWVDPEEAITVIFMTQLIPSGCYPVRNQLRAAVYQALC